jgi:DNA-binding GntR family transcriptional regulator
MPAQPHRSYRQVANDLEAAIRRDEFSADAQGRIWLPKNPELASMYNVSLTTLQRAFGLLEERGLITRHQGKGVQVCPPDDTGAPAVPPYSP